MRWIAFPLALMSLSGPALAQDTADETVEKPAAIVADGIPAIPQSLANETRPYFEYRTAGFSGWDATDRSMIISTRFGAYGDRFGAAGVVAISNFVTFLENTEDYRRDLRRVEYGDERDPEQRAKLIEISPLTRGIASPRTKTTASHAKRTPITSTGRS